MIENSINIDFDNIDAAIFDIDGTLIDSMWMWHAIDVEYLGRFHIEVPENLQKDIAGMSFVETADYFKRTFPIEDSKDKMMDDWNLMALYKYENEVTAKVGVIDFINQLKNKGIKIGIGTSNSYTLAKAGLISTGIFELVDSLHTANEVKTGKPAPDIYLLVAKDLDVKPSRCIVFEDISNGILAAKNAGMKSVAVKDAFSDYELDYKISLADYYVDNYKNIKI